MPNTPSFNMAPFDWSGPVSAGIEVDQYLGVWAVEPNCFAQLLSLVRGINWSTHAAENSGKDHSKVEASYASSGSGRDSATVGMVQISGVMTKRGSSLSGAGSTVRTRQLIRQLANDPGVDSIIVLIDSPGGTVSGTSDLADAVAYAASRKRTVAYIEDLGASAAYWVASQATEIVANSPTAKIGSIGVFNGVYDMSEAFAKEGVKPIVVKTGELKGVGFPGDTITEEQISHIQSLVDADFARFKAVIASGRKMTAEQVDKVATGGVFDATQALSLGLIDRIEAFDSVVSKLQAEIAVEKHKRNNEMAFHDIVNACGGIDTEAAEDCQFIVAQLKAEATPEAAQKAWCETLKARAEIAREEATKAREDSAKELPGVDPLVEEKSGKEGGIGSVQEARDFFEEEVSSRVNGGMSRTKAISAVTQKFPEVIRAMRGEF